MHGLGGVALERGLSAGGGVHCLDILNKSNLGLTGFAISRPFNKGLIGLAILNTHRACINMEMHSVDGFLRKEQKALHVGVNAFNIYFYTLIGN